MPKIQKATHEPARPEEDLHKSQTASGASSAPREAVCSASAQGTLSHGAEAYCSDTVVAAAYRSAGVLPVAGDYLTACRCYGCQHAFNSTRH